MLDTPFSPWPSYSQEEIDAVQRVLLSNKVNYWTGQECRHFETEYASFTGTEYAIAVANGTVALELALRGLGIGQGDEVIVSPRTYIASASAIVNAGATPIFADVDPDSQNISATTIEAVISHRTRAVICVHHAGWPCDMAPILSLATAHDLKVIEDCAQAHGATYKGRPVGSIGHIGCWSFCQDKIITTGGEGGMVTTSDPSLWSAMWSFKDHGKGWETVFAREHPPGFRWLHDSFGTNLRMTEMQAAIGRIQLGRMEQWTAKRQANCQTIWQTARNCYGLRAPKVPGTSCHAGYKCYVFVEPDTLRKDWNRDRIMATINSKGVPCLSGSCPEVYLETCFQDAKLTPENRLPVAKALGETSLMLLAHPTLRPADIQKTCDVLKDVMDEATV